MSIINKNGVWNSPQFYETGGINLASISDFGYVPTTETNSCTNVCFVDFTNCTPGQLMHTSMDIIWSGFDTSNTAGTFSINFQGDRFNKSTSAWEWNGTSNMFNTAYNNSASLTSLVLSKTSGTYHVEMDFILASDMPTTYIRHRFGIRSNYSNGTGRIDIKNLVVSPVANQGSPIHINPQYTAAREFYEI